ncbi:MAG: hypothetical protein B7Z06_00755, partial [Flavobacteriales bacterium 32-35-8]
MKRHLLFLVITLSLLNCETKKTIEVKQENNNQIVIGQIDTLYSDILKENREIWVHIPKSATKNQSKYPVLYLLDGDAHFYSVTGMIEQLSTVNGNTVSPEMVVIGIINTDRTRDLTPTHMNGTSGGGEKFLNFVERELIPYIEKTYPVIDYKTFVGHSLGGLTVIDALIERPELFNNYVAIDPSLWWDNQELLKRANKILSNNTFEGKSLYVALANNLPNNMRFDEVINDTTKDTEGTRSIIQFVRTTESLKNNRLNFDWKYYENENHGLVPIIAEYDALRFLFQWNVLELNQLNQFYPPNNAPFNDLLNLIDSHFKNVSNHFGYEIYPPEWLIIDLGKEFLNNQEPEKAYKLFKLNLQNFPNSSNAYD